MTHQDHLEDLEMMGNSSAHLVLGGHDHVPIIEMV
jgi:hypothetical protein